MDDSETRKIFILILIMTIIFTGIYFIYLFIIIKYIFTYFKSKKLSILWLQYTTTLILNFLLFAIYLVNLFYTKNEAIIIFNKEQNPCFIIIFIIFFIANIFNIINNLIYDVISSCFIIKNLKKLININQFNSKDMILNFKEISTNFFNKNKNMMFYFILTSIDIFIIIAFVIKYINYGEKETKSFFSLKNIIIFILKLGNIICFLALIVVIFLKNFFKKRILNKYTYINELFEMKIYNIFYNKNLFSFDIISFKIVVDLIINCPVLLLLIFKVNNYISWILSGLFIYLYILIFGALILKIDKMNEIGKISKSIKFWFLWKNINFSFNENDNNNYLYENVNNYSQEQKKILIDLKIINDIDEYEKIKEEMFVNKININESFKSSLIEDNRINIDKLSTSQFESKLKSQKKLNFNISSELYVLYKLLMLYFEKNEYVYSKLQNQINEDGTPFKQFYSLQNISKNKKKKVRQTFGGINDLANKNYFISNIDRISRISKLNSSSVLSFLKLSEQKIFFSLEEKELKEEFKYKFNLEKEAIFKIESLETNSFFELFPFCQISIQDIIKSLNPSDNKKTNDILLKEKNKKSKNNNIESESEDNLFYTFNSLLMMEVYDPQEFISSKDLSKFVSSYGEYLLDIIKNINFTFIPLIIGIFNVEIAGENKVVILYRNPLFFTNFNKYNHWINFCLTEGPEKIKASIFQNEIDINEIEIKNNLKLSEADYEEVTNNLKRDFDFFVKINIQVYPIIHLFIGDEKDYDNIHINESSIIENTSIHPTNLSGFLNETDDNIISSNNINNNLESGFAYKTESNSLIDKEYYSMNGDDIHTIKIYFTHFFRLDCELNRQKDIDNNNILKSNHYCQYLEGQTLTYLSKTTMFEIQDNENN